MSQWMPGQQLQDFTPDEADDFSSEGGVDYSKLRDLLAAGQWKEADEETVAVMLALAGREEEGWLTEENVKHFPCKDLNTIDQLWLKYSNGRFGFSVQNSVWESIGGKPDANWATYERLGDRLGWRVNNEWVNYSDLTFSLDACEGHLPISWFVWCAGGGRVVFSRFQSCSL